MSRSFRAGKVSQQPDDDMVMGKFHGPFPQNEPHSKGTACVMQSSSCSWDNQMCTHHPICSKGRGYLLLGESQKRHLGCFQDASTSLVTAVHTQGRLQPVWSMPAPVTKTNVVCVAEFPKQAWNCYKHSGKFLSKRALFKTFNTIIRNPFLEPRPRFHCYMRPCFNSLIA